MSPRTILRLDERGLPAVNGVSYEGRIMGEVPPNKELIEDVGLMMAGKSPKSDISTWKPAPREEIVCEPPPSCEIPVKQRNTPKD